MNPMNNQKGIAMALALMMTLVLTLMAAGLMYTVVNEKKLTGNQMRYAQSLAVSRAGLYEALARLSTIDQAVKIGQDLTQPITPDWTCLIFADNPPAGTGSFDQRQTVQTGANVLEYTVPYSGGAFDSSLVLTVRYKRQDRNGNGTIDGTDEIYFYDYKQKRITLGQVSSDHRPVFEITSTGRVGTTRRTIVSELVIPKLNIGAKAAVRSGVAIRGNGTVDICGHDHLITTPAFTEPPNCFPDQPGQPSGWHVSRNPALHGSPPDYAHAVPTTECTAAGCLPGGESDDEITSYGVNKKFWGNPDAIQFSTSPVPEIWEILGMTEAECNAQTWGTNINPVNGFVKVENAGGNIHLPVSANHIGVLWVKGSLQVQGNTAFRGLVYVEEDFKNVGTPWILGAVCTKGVTETTLNGTINILYSSAMLEQVIMAAAGTGMKIVSQREVD
ncbi:MAG TPA: hypothetical protein DDW31_04510 [candidate division Zixibacteria bacterium]|nr:hypothetical protein [candidate division Zixibacteria bacterium]